MTDRFPSATALAALALTLALSGCASRSDLASRPKPVQYAHMNCGQLSAESHRLSAQIAAAGDERQSLEQQHVALQRAYSFSQCYLFASL